MSRLIRQLVSSLTIVGYFLAVTWAPAWHDHHHEHCHHAHTAQEPVSDASHSHACCLHQQHDCGTEAERSPEAGSSQSPCPAPLHDDDCVVCRVFAHSPMAAPEIQIVDADQPLVERLILFGPQAVSSLPAVYDSRGPPTV